MRRRTTKTSRTPARSGRTAAVLAAALGVAAAGALAPAPAAAQPTFAGDYCGRHEVRVVTTVRLFGIRLFERTDTLAFDVSARVYQAERPPFEPLISGRGVAEGEGRRILFSITGAVTGPGAAEGTVSAPGVGTAGGTAWLAPDGDSVVVRGLDHRVRLSKAACGNRAPSARILRPSGGATVPWATPVELAGTGSDPEDPVVPLQRLVWRSSRDGRLGSGQRLRRDFLSLGRHVITLTVTDSGGRSASDSVELTIADSPPNPPAIVSPAAGARLTAGLPATLRGRASDRETGALTGRALSWRSDRDGALGTGERLSVRLSEGRHVLTLTARDPAGGERSASVTVEVVAPAGDAPPAVAIQAPPELTGIADTDCLVLAASALDLEDGPLPSGAIAWTARYVDAAGATVRRPLGTGARIEVCSWPTTGHDTVHTVEATATDSAGGSGRDAVRVYVIPGGLI